MTGPGGPSRGDRLADLAAFAWIVAFAATAVALALAYPFGHGFDELEHYSMIVALHEAPTLFPDFGTYRVLAPDRANWSDLPNYLAHPPLYHLLMAPLAGLFPGDVRPIRLADVVLVTGGLLAAWSVGRKRFAGAGDRLVFTLAIFGLPATCGVAALVNNDDLLVAEFALVLALLLAERPRPIALGLLVAAVGWTKFNGFVALLLLLAFVRLFDLRRDGLRPTASDGAVFVGAAVGAIPALTTLVRFGRLVWVPASFPPWFDHVRPEALATLTPIDFAVWFFHATAQRFAARVDGPDLALAVAGLMLLALPLLRPLAGPADRSRDVARAGLLAFLAYAGLHAAYAWHSVWTAGSLVEAQARYWMAPWVGFAFGLAMAVATLPAGAARLARIFVVAVILATSLPASLAVTLLAPSSPTTTSPRPATDLLAPPVPEPPSRPPGPPARTP